MLKDVVCNHNRLMKTCKYPYCGSCDIGKNGSANGVPRTQCYYCKHNFTFPENRSKYKIIPQIKKSCLGGLL